MSEGAAALAMIPIENSIAGRVADIHYLLPHSGLHIVGEHFLPIHFQLMGIRGAQLDTIQTVQSHIHALGQCRSIIRKLKLKAVVSGDTAGSAREVAELGDPTPRRARPAHGCAALRLRHLRGGCRGRAQQYDALHPAAPSPRGLRQTRPTVTSFVFRVRNVPAALYKAMGGFATNGVNMTKLESYQLDGSFHRDAILRGGGGPPEERLVRSPSRNCNSSPPNSVSWALTRRRRFEADETRRVRSSAGTVTCSAATT